MARSFKALWIPCALILIAACDGPPSEISGSLEEATVHGTITVAGKPVNNGAITFRCANAKRPTVAPQEVSIAKDGSYSIKTLVGQNYVEIGCNELRVAKLKRYLNQQQTIHVDSGDNTVNFDFPPKPQS